MRMRAGGSLNSVCSPSLIRSLPAHHAMPRSTESGPGMYFFRDSGSSAILYAVSSGLRQATERRVTSFAIRLPHRGLYQSRHWPIELRGFYSFSACFFKQDSASQGMVRFVPIGIED